MSSPAYDAILQVIGVAYTYQPSRAMRRRLTANLTRHHSSQTQDFSYFFKSEPEHVVRSGMPLRLRAGLDGEESVPHWPEPELVVLLGPDHEPVGYTLGNDLTAFAIEARGRDERFDGTYFGKCWPGSCALGPRFVTPEELGDDCQEGDVITISCPQIGELSNTVARAEPARAGLPSRPLRAGLP